MGDGITHEVVCRDTLERGRHENAGQARPGLPLVERLHRLARRVRHLLGEALDPGFAARADRVLAEASSKHRIDEQALEETGGGVGFPSGHLKSRLPLRSRIGPPNTAITGTNNATHTAARAAQTTGSGAISASCCS